MAWALGYITKIGKGYRAHYLREFWTFDDLSEAEIWLKLRQQASRPLQAHSQEWVWDHVKKTLTEDELMQEGHSVCPRNGDLEIWEDDSHVPLLKVGWEEVWVTPLDAPMDIPSRAERVRLYERRVSTGQLGPIIRKLRARHLHHIILL